MGRIGERLLWSAKYHLRENKGIYAGFAICVAAGLVFGIILHFLSGIGSFFLNDGEQVVFDFIKSDVSVFRFFFNKLLNFFIAILLVFVFSLSVYSSFLCYVFYVYQSFVFSAVCCEIISVYGFLGAVNVFILLVPINIVLLLLVFVSSVTCVSRAVSAKRYNIDFKSSFLSNRGYWKILILCLVAAFVFLLVISLVLSVVLRSVSFVLF